MPGRGFNLPTSTASLKLRSTSEVRYTRSKAPFELVWYCAFKDKKKALGFEKYLKQGSGFAFARKRLI
ncbi:MAG: GIY-YIG nuclease family protein [Patescibacteria group bacterium]